MAARHLKGNPRHLKRKGRMSTPRAKPKYYLTTPLYYTNGLPHIGHTYSTIVADVIRRYKRMRWVDVFITTGADGHGVNLERSAIKAARTPPGETERDCPLGGSRLRR